MKLKEHLAINEIASSPYATGDFAYYALLI